MLLVNKTSSRVSLLYLFIWWQHSTVVDVYGSVVFVINTDFRLVTIEYDTNYIGERDREKDCFIIGRTVVKYQTT